MIQFFIVNLQHIMSCNFADEQNRNKTLHWANNTGSHLQRVKDSNEVPFTTSNKKAFQ